MAQDWEALPLDKPLFANLDADAVVGYQTAIENGFINELGGHTRFPGLKVFAPLGGKARVYLHDFDGDLIAATSQGQTYRIDRRANVANVTAVPVAGGRRVVFAKTDQALLMAAGGPIVRLRDRTTEILSQAAPKSTHVAWIDNFTIAIEINSGRFFNSGAGAPDSWNPLDVFAADGNPDNINSLLVTPFRELLLGGENSIEQFERLTTGVVPFFRRWAIGDGVKLPYALVFADSATWLVNSANEVVRFQGQNATPKSDAIGKLLEEVDDWTDTFIGGYPDKPLHWAGQKFILLQIPNATNPYGTKGITLVYDYRQSRWFSLYGWDSANAVPSRYPIWSHWRLWDRTFAGGEGVIYELTDEVHTNADQVQRWLVRTSHIAQGNALQIQNLRLQIKRGLGGSATAPTIQVRCSRDGKPFGQSITRSLGKAGERLQMIEFGHFGTGSHFQFEFACTDDCPVNLLKAEIKTMPVGH